MPLGYLAVMIATTTLIVGSLYAAGHALFSGVEYHKLAAVQNGVAATSTTTGEMAPIVWPLELDREEYNARLLDLVDYVPPVRATTSTSTPLVSDLVFASSSNVTVRGKRWPPENLYPHGGAILPFERIVAYYGNFYSRFMGILGEFDRQTVLNRLASTTAAWEAADPDTPVVPAIHYIAMVAQADAGEDGMYRAVMPADQIELAYDMAQEIDGILFLDLQVGLSTIQRELPQFREYFTRPDVHLGIDPEFAMAPSGRAPATVIGTYDAKDINFAINWLSEIVREHQLPPKVLVVHRFTQNMVTNYQDIQPTPEVQVVIHMDGWGSKELKLGTYTRVIEPEPVQFVGLKIFYKNDLKPPSTGIYTPAEALRLHPEPVYIQYQ
ncbi:hypothetical protein CL655_00865 [bacterium]|nr:hypothetical protein [bacterium]|tara:strand:+ start:6458 stop:7603 length:1146 start_codon:yes stop_codon:yes gene_type:complete